MFNDVKVMFDLKDGLQSVAEIKNELLYQTFEYGEEHVIYQCAKDIFNTLITREPQAIMNAKLVCNAMGEVFNFIDVILALRMTGLDESLITTITKEMKV